MSLKGKLGASLRALGKLPVIAGVLYAPSVRRRLQVSPGFRHLYDKGWGLLHPFDVEFGTDTSGYVPSEQLPNSSISGTHLHVYAGSQPSIIREALRQIPNPGSYTFVDLGCGKGRPVLVASEFPFRECIGVELSSALADRAIQNVERMARAHPERAPMRIVQGDAAAFDLPAGNVVVFLYNPFGEDVMRRVVANIEKKLESGAPSLFVVYYNPVWGECLDAASQLRRYFAADLPYAPDERGFGPDELDPVVIWQGGSSHPAHAGAGSKIVVVNPNYRAALGD